MTALRQLTYPIECNSQADVSDDLEENTENEHQNERILIGGGCLKVFFWKKS